MIIASLAAAGQVGGASGATASFYFSILLCDAWTVVWLVAVVAVALRATVLTDVVLAGRASIKLYVEPSRVQMALPPRALSVTLAVFVIILRASYIILI